MPLAMRANATRTVTVVDTTSPVLTLLSDLNMTHAKDTTWGDPGATASDSLDGNLTSSITVSGTVDVNTTGVYTLTYSVSDNTSNEVNATRTVTVGMAQHELNLPFNWKCSGWNLAPLPWAVRRRKRAAIRSRR